MHQSSAFGLIRGHPLWAIAALAFALRLGYWLAVRPNPMDMVDSVEYDALARGLLAGHGILDLVTYQRPPLYPVVVALSYASGGIGVLIAVQLVLSAATAPLVGLLAGRLTGAPKAAVMGALITAVYPWFFQWFGGLASETLFTFLLVGALLAILAAADQPSVGRIVAAGILLGLASLTRANALVIAPFIALWWWWTSKDIRRPVLLALAVILTLLPYSLYNLAAGNGFVVASNGGGLLFYEGNNPDTVRFYDPATPLAEWRALNDASTIGPQGQIWLGCTAEMSHRECFTTAPPSQREQFFYSAAFSFIRAHPGDWALTELRKLGHYWRPWTEPRAYPTSVVIVSGLSFGMLLVASAVALVRLPRRAALFLIAIIVGSTLSSVLWSVQLRYRFAMLDPFLIAAASEPLLALFQRARTWRVVRQFASA